MIQSATIVQMWPNERFVIVISIVLGKKFRSLCKRRTALSTLADTLCRYSSNVDMKSNMAPSCFWEKVWETILLLKTKGGRVNHFDLQLKITFWACLLGSGLKLIFHWKDQSLTFFESSFNSFVEVFTSRTTENNEVSSAKSFAYGCQIFW